MKKNTSNTSTTGKVVPLQAQAVLHQTKVKKSKYVSLEDYIKRRKQHYNKLSSREEKAAEKIANKLQREAEQINIKAAKEAARKEKAANTIKGKRNAKRRASQIKNTSEIYFTNGESLYKKFPDDASAKEFIIEHMHQNKPICPKCDQAQKDIKNNTIIFKDRYRVECRECRHRFTIFTGTMFENSRVGCRNWLIAIFSLNNNPQITAITLGRDLGVNHKTAHNLIRKISLNGYTQKNITFDNKPKQLDTTVIDGENRNRHKHLKSNSGSKTRAHVGVIVEDDGKMVAEVLPNIQAETLKNFARPYLKEGDYLFTDGASTLNDFTDEFGVIHAVVIHSKGEFVKPVVKRFNDELQHFEFVDADYTTEDMILANTNNVENKNSIIKKFMFGKFFKHLKEVLNRIVFAHNMRLESPSAQMVAVLKNATNATKITVGQGERKPIINIPVDAESVAA